MVEALPCTLQLLDAALDACHALMVPSGPSPQRHWRRLLGALLVVQACLLCLVFPLLLISVETQSFDAARERAGEETLTPTAAGTHLSRWMLLVRHDLPSAQTLITLPQTPAGKLLSRRAAGPKVLSTAVMGASIHAVVGSRQGQRQGLACQRYRRQHETAQTRALRFGVNGMPMLLRGQATQELAAQLAPLAVWLARNPRADSPRSPDDEDPPNNPQDLADTS